MMILIIVGILLAYLIGPGPAILLTLAIGLFCNILKEY